MTFLCQSHIQPNMCQHSVELCCSMTEPLKILRVQPYLTFGRILRPYTASVRQKITTSGFWIKTVLAILGLLEVVESILGVRPLWPSEHSQKTKTYHFSPNQGGCAPTARSSRCE